MIGAILQKERKARGLSLGRLALGAGVNKSTLSRWEAGKNLPSVHELRRVLEVLELPAPVRQACYRHLDAPRALEAIRRESVGTGGPVSSGELLRALRVRSGLSQTEAARAAGVTRSLLSQWERNHCWPDGGKLHQLCYGLGATAEELVFLTVRGWQQLEPLPDDKDALDGVISYLEYHDSSENRGLTYLALAGRYQALYLKGKLSAVEAANVWGHYAYYLCWRLQRYTDAARVVAPVAGLLKGLTRPLSWGQREAVSALVQCHLHYKQESQARELLQGIEEQVPSLSRSWWFDFNCQVAEKAGHPLQAAGFQREAARTATSAYEQTRRQIRLAGVLCRHGQFRDGLTLLAPLESAFQKEGKTHPGAQCELLLNMAWALAGVGERAVAQSYLERISPHLPTVTRRALADNQLAPLSEIYWALSG